MRHPLEFIPPQKRTAAFWSLLASTTLIAILMNSIGAPLNNAIAPAGIVDFELAGASQRAAEIVASWDARAQLHAALSLGFDYLFMLSYAAFLSLACLLSADVLRRRAWPLSGLGAPLGWGQWLAALLDAIENLALIRILFNGVDQPWPAVARLCAQIKFALIILGLLYALFGLVARLMQRRSVRI